MDSKITRSSGFAVDGGYIVGGGMTGITKELDDLVKRAAEELRKHFRTDVIIRFNSDRYSGGAWLVDSPLDNLLGNDSVGLTVALVNSKLRSMSVEEAMKLNSAEWRALSRNPDSFIFFSAINVEKTINSVSPDSEHLFDHSEYCEFNSLDQARDYLFSHVSGLKEPFKLKKPLEKQIHSASARTGKHVSGSKAKAKDTAPER